MAEVIICVCINAHKHTPIIVYICHWLIFFLHTFITVHLCLQTDRLRQAPEGWSRLLIPSGEIWEVPFSNLWHTLVDFASCPQCCLSGSKRRCCHDWWIKISCRLKREGGNRKVPTSCLEPASLWGKPVFRKNIIYYILPKLLKVGKHSHCLQVMDEVFSKML